MPRTDTVAMTARGHQGALPPQPVSAQAGKVPRSLDEGDKRNHQARPFLPLPVLFFPAGRTSAAVRGRGTAGPPRGAASAAGRAGAPSEASRPLLAPLPELMHRGLPQSLPGNGGATPGVRHFSGPAVAGRPGFRFWRGGTEVPPRLLPRSHRLHLCPEPRTHPADRTVSQATQTCLWEGG